MSGLAAFLGKLGHLKGVMEHLIVIGLVGFGTLLAPAMAPEETALQYELRTFQVSGTSAAYLQIGNPTNRAITVTLRSPIVRPLVFSTSFQGSTLTSADEASWSGWLLPQKQLAVLLVVQGDLPESLVGKLIKGTYSVVDESTGALVEHSAVVRETSALPVARSVRYAAWLMAPLVVAGVLFVLWALYRSRKGGAKTPPPTGD